jgi:hypothetical protein
MLKSALEVKRIHIIRDFSIDKFSAVINVISRASYFIHWICDNFYVLSKIGFINSSTRVFYIISRVCWLIGLFLFCVYCMKTLRKTYNDESDLKVAAIDKMTVKQMRESLRKICSLRREYHLNFLRSVADLMVCMNELNLPLIILGKRLNNGVEGMSGVIASLTFLYCLL